MKFPKLIQGIAGWRASIFEAIIAKLQKSRGPIFEKSHDEFMITNAL